MAGKDKPAFAAIPLRALVDDRILPSHLRVLAVIAAHDHMSLPREKGAGCFISNQRLAALTHLNYSVVARIQTELESWDYLIRERRDEDRRQKTSRVVYNDDDRTAFSRALESAGPEIVCPETNDLPDIVCHEAKNGGEIVCLAGDETDVNSDACASEYIPRRGGIDSAKQGNKFSETARPKNSIARAIGKLVAGEYEIEDVTAFLSIVEREVKRDPRQMTERVARILEAATVQFPDTSIINHAQRILETYDVYDNTEDCLADERQDEPAGAEASDLPGRQVDEPDTVLTRAEAVLAEYCKTGFPIGLIGKQLAVIEREMKRTSQPASDDLIESLKSIVMNVHDSSVQQQAGRLLGEYNIQPNADPEELYHHNERTFQ